MSEIQQNLSIFPRLLNQVILTWSKNQNMDYVIEKNTDFRIGYK